MPYSRDLRAFKVAELSSTIHIHVHFKSIEVLSKLLSKMLSKLGEKRIYFMFFSTNEIRTYVANICVDIYKRLSYYTSNLKRD